MTATTCLLGYFKPLLCALLLLVSSTFGAAATPAQLALRDAAVHVTVGEERPTLSLPGGHCELTELSTQHLDGYLLPA